MIDYITLLLLNMTAGHFLLAAYVLRGLDSAEPRDWAPAFVVVGAIGLGFGAHMTATWPLPGPYNSAYGEMSVLFGVLFLGAGVALARGMGLLGLAFYALFAGVAALVLGARVGHLSLTAKPAMTAVGFVLSGLAGVLAAPFLLYWRDSLRCRWAAAGVLGVAGALWALTTYMAYWGHMAAFADWKPLTMR